MYKQSLPKPWLFLGRCIADLEIFFKHIEDVALKKSNKDKKTESCKSLSL